MVLRTFYVFLIILTSQAGFKDKEDIELRHSYASSVEITQETLLLTLEIISSIEVIVLSIEPANNSKIILGPFEDPFDKILIKFLQNGNRTMKTISIQ